MLVNLRNFILRQLFNDIFKQFERKKLFVNLNVHVTMVTTDKQTSIETNLAMKDLSPHVQYQIWSDNSHNQECCGSNSQQCAIQNQIKKLQILTGTETGQIFSRMFVMAKKLKSCLPLL